MLRFIFIIILSVVGFVPDVMATKRALLIGIGDYDAVHTGWNAIHGDDDVALLAPVLEKHGFKVSSVVNEKAVKTGIVAALKKLAKECGAGDKVYIHFSGHGQPVVDCNGDEKRGYDEAFVPYDAYKSERFTVKERPYGGENHLVDDELAPLIEAVRGKLGSGGELFIAFDACYSRGLERGEELDDTLDMDELPEFMRGTADYLKPSDRSHLRSIPMPEKFKPGCVMAVVSACHENERNFEHRVGNRYYGSLSYCIYKLLHKNDDFNSWIKYFQTKAYDASGCFVIFQHPEITVYK